MQYSGLHPCTRNSSCMWRWSLYTCRVSRHSGLHSCTHHFGDMQLFVASDKSSLTCHTSIPRHSQLVFCTVRSRGILQCTSTPTYRIAIYGHSRMALHMAPRRRTCEPSHRLVVSEGPTNRRRSPQRTNTLPVLHAPLLTPKRIARMTGGRARMNGFLHPATPHS